MPADVDFADGALLPGLMPGAEGFNVLGELDTVAVLHGGPSGAGSGGQCWWCWMPHRRCGLRQNQSRGAVARAGDCRATAIGGAAGAQAAAAVRVGLRRRL